MGAPASSPLRASHTPAKRALTDEPPPQKTAAAAPANSTPRINAVLGALTAPPTRRRCAERRHCAEDVAAQKDDTAQKTTQHKKTTLRQKTSLRRKTTLRRRRRCRPVEAPGKLPSEEPTANDSTQ
jgi:hypothetical protein